MASRAWSLYDPKRRRFLLGIRWQTKDEAEQARHVFGVTSRYRNGKCVTFWSPQYERAIAVLTELRRIG